MGEPQMLNSGDGAQEAEDHTQERLWGEEEDIRPRPSSQGA
jgi:hypothetical protein